MNEMRLAVALIGLAVIAWLAGRRRAARLRRRSNDMRHVTQINRWWGRN
jgi:hypothetical protein